MNAHRLANGNLFIPRRAEYGSFIGEGMTEIGPDDPEYADWDKFLSAAPKKADHAEEVAAFRAVLELQDAIDRLGKADDPDDHFYGAWSGGSKQEGGHPGRGGAHTQAKPKKPVKFTPDDIKRAREHWEQGAAARKIQEDEAAAKDAVRKLRDLAAARADANKKPDAVTLAPKDAPQGGTHLAVTAFERDIMAKNPKVEWGQVFDADGNPLTPPTKGTASRVKFPSQYGLPWRGGTLTHLHPTRANTAPGESVSLSLKDVAVALDGSLGAVRAFTSDGSWMEIRNTGYAFNSTSFSWKFNDNWKRAQRGQWWSEPMGAGPDFDLASKAYFQAYRDTMIATVNEVRPANYVGPAGPGSRYFDGLEIRTGKQ